MPALDAHHQRLRLHEDLATPIGRTLASAWLASERSSKVASVLGGGTQHALRVRSEGFPDYLRARLDMAETFYASPDMITLAEHASRTMPNEPLLPEDLPASSGFLWLPQPLHHCDIRGRLMSTSAILWCPAPTSEPSIWLFYFADRDDPDDEINVEARAIQPLPWDTMPRLHVQHMAALPFGQPLPLSIDTGGLHALRIAFADLEIVPDVNLAADGKGVEVSWHSPSGAVSEQINESLNAMLAKHPVTSMPEPVMRFLVTFFRLCQQSLTSVTKQPVDRPLRRRLERVQMSTAPVTVVTLRRVTVDREPGEHPVDWSHRWLVRGHWRQQPYKVDGEWITRAIYINPYVKGPEDRPLLVREHVQALTR